MASGERKILILAGRLSRYDARWPLAPGSIAWSGAGAACKCSAYLAGSVLADDPRCFELPALGNRWMRGWAVRSLWSSEQLQRPDLVHVVHDEMSEAALILSESAELPYIQTVADFRTLGRGLRLSRRWCRQVVAIRPDLAAGLVDELGVPESAGRRHRAGDRPCPRSRPAAPAAGRVPVIGAGGPLDEVSRAAWSSSRPPAGSSTPAATPSS